MADVRQEKMYRRFLISAFVLALISLYAVNAKVKSKESLSSQLESRVQQLLDMNSKRPVLRFNGEKFKTYIKSNPRNYSIVVMLTALAPQRQCGICKEVNAEFQILAGSWRYSGSFNSRLFFVMIDFDEGSDVFQSLKLNSAPVIMHFPPKGKPKKIDTFDMPRYGFQAEQISKWVAERTDVQSVNRRVNNLPIVYRCYFRWARNHTFVHRPYGLRENLEAGTQATMTNGNPDKIRIIRPPNYFFAVTIGVVLAGIGALLYVRRKSLEFIYNKDYWAIGALSIVFIMISGQMWNHIRGPPYAHRNPQSGEIVYIHGSSDGQLVAETYIVFALYAMVTLGFILLNEKAKAQVDIKKRRLFMLGGLGILVFFFSLILSIFRSKYHGYPYSFLFK